MFQDVFGGTRVAYEASRRRESLSGSLSVSSVRHVFGIGLLGSFWVGYGCVGSGFVFFVRKGVWLCLVVFDVLWRL